LGYSTADVGSVLAFSGVFLLLNSNIFNRNGLF
jgi:hypothetical protein